MVSIFLSAAFIVDKYQITAHHVENWNHFLMWFSSSDKLSPTFIAIASATTTVTIVFFAVLVIIALIAAYLRHTSRVTHIHQITSVYEEVTSQQERKGKEMIAVQSNEAYQESTTIVNAAYAQVHF